MDEDDVEAPEDLDNTVEFTSDQMAELRALTDA